MAEDQRDEELFLRNEQSSGGPETPSVGPLRINKQASPPPQNQYPGDRSYSTSPPPRAYGASPSADANGGAPALRLNTTSPQLLNAYTYTKPSTSAPNRPLPYPSEAVSSAAAISGRGAPPGANQSLEGAPQANGSSTAYQYPMATYPTSSYSADTSSPSLSTIAARRGKPLPESPGPETPDKEGLFQEATAAGQHSEADDQAHYDDEEPHSAITEVAYNYYGHASPPKKPAIPSINTTQFASPVPQGYGINRLASTASVSTTRGTRGSPPPPETPIETNSGGIEARYAAAGIAGPSTLTSLQAQTLQSQSIASQQRQAQYSGRPQQGAPSDQVQRQDPPRRPWTPTEDVSSPDSRRVSSFLPHGMEPNASPPRSGVQQGANQRRGERQNTLEQDMQGLQVSDEPPPAYSTIPGQRIGYPDEKGRPTQQSQQQQQVQQQVQQQRRQQSISTTKEQQVQQHMASESAGEAGQAGPSSQEHPAFANQNQTPAHAENPHAALLTTPGALGSTPSPAPSQASQGSQGRASPPPLPEGWISHLDPSSGQYYYIHIPTQMTQWEFPKGVTPLSLNDVPTSPTATLVNPFSSPIQSKFPLHSGLASPGGATPLASPGFAPSLASFQQSISSPTAAGFQQLPPMAGHEQYRVAATNGVYFGPYLRYTNMDVDNGIWFGSIMMVTDAPQPPTVHLHQSLDLSPNPRQLKANHIHQHRRWGFYRFDLDIRMEQQETRWTYAVTSHLGCTRYEFVVAGATETSWRFIAHSGNDFAINVSANERTRLGGVGYMWKDVLQKHSEVGGFHAQIGMGNLIYADRLWKEIPLLRQWTATSGKENRKNAAWTPQHEEDIGHAYFHFYTSHLDQPLLRDAFAQIPHILTLDDHDIFDGYGSYPPHFQQSNIMRNVGRLAYTFYLLFQQHTTPQILANVRDDLDLFTITGNGWHFLKYLGPSVVVCAPDTRSERTQTQVLAGPTYQGLFPKIATLPPCVQHCLVILPVPIIYPRLEAAEQMAQTLATGKKVATGTFNALGKVAGGVAGIVGAKSVVGEGFNSVKKAVGKSGLMSNVLNPFGEVDVLDEVRDVWTHESKDLERTYLIRTLSTISHSKSMRVTFLSGSTNTCGVGLVHDPATPNSHKTLYQIVSSSIVNAPPSTYALRLLHPQHATSPPVWIPQNGHRSVKHGGPASDMKEDMLEVFGVDVTGAAREMKKLMGRRNYAVFLAFDPEAVEGAFSGADPLSDMPGKSPMGAGRVSLAVDLMVQAEANTYGGAATVKYGPIIVPNLEYGK